MNISYLIGNLTKEPEKVEGNSKSLCKLNLAVSENYTDKDGNRPVHFFNVAVWGVLADNCMKFLHKGSKICVVGKLNPREYEKDGQKKYVMEIVATEIEFLNTPKKDS